MNKKTTFILGVTGGIGSGKSEACKILEKLGAIVFYSDKAAKQAMNNDKLLKRDLVLEFGDDVFAPDGNLSNEYLSKIVFDDVDKLNRLNSLVHPYVFDLFKNVVQSSSSQGIDIVVKEAALIFETGAERFLDGVLVIDTPYDLKIERLKKRSGPDIENLENQQ